MTVVPTKAILIAVGRDAGKVLIEVRIVERRPNPEGNHPLDALEHQVAGGALTISIIHRSRVKRLR